MDDKPTSSTNINEPTINKSEWPSKHRIMSFLLALLVALGAGFVGGYYGNKQSNSSPISNTPAEKAVNTESQLISKIVREVGPSVVSVNVEGIAQQQTPFGERRYKSRGAGTGFILNKEGVVVTNRHVVPKQTKSVSVTLSDGTELKNVEVIGRTSSTDTLDIAFLKIKDTKGKELVPAKLGDSSKVQVGEKVVAIGNALGQFQNTVTSGIISGYGRSIQAGDESSDESETLQNLFQTDASINQGNSGGPLVNMAGQVIGINTAVAGEAENIGFAIPVEDAKGLIDSVLRTGKLQRPYLGVRYIALTDDYAYEFNLNTKRGAYIPPSSEDGPSILKDSPASEAGLEEKDIIIKVNDINIDDKSSLASVLGRFSVGDKVTLTIVRGDKTITKDVTLRASQTE